MNNKTFIKLSLISTLLLMMFIMPQVSGIGATKAYAAPMDYEYSIIGGKVTITHYIGSGGDITIPTTIDGYNVNAIETYAFQSCRSLTSVIIPNSVTSIGSGAFAGCPLASVDIPNSVTSIGDDVFYSCSYLVSVDIPNSVTSIGVNAFCSCSNLKSVIIPSSVTSIGDCAFQHCYSLTNVDIQNGVTSIGANAFSECGFTSVDIPSSVKSIGDCAFAYGLLSKIKFYGNAPTMGYTVFCGCDSSTFTIYYISGTTGFTDPYCGYTPVPVKIVTLSYDGNGNTTGTAPVDNNVYISGDEFTTLENYGSLSKTGYTFLCWDTKADGTGIDYHPGHTYSIYEDMILYAKWIPNKYTVTFNSNSESIVPNKIVDYNNLLVTPTNPTKTGYTFGGWYKEAGCINAWNFAVDRAVTDTTLYAKWMAKPVILGVANKTIKVGDSFDAKAGVTATDEEDGNLTSKITVTGSVNSKVAGQYTITYNIIDNDGNKTTQSMVVSVVPVNVHVTSLVGTNRYDTAIKLSQSQYSAADTVIIVNGGAMADGLGATPLAKFKNAPLLLTETNSLPDSTIREIKRLNAKNVIIVGGAGVVSDNIKLQLQKLVSNVERIYGSDRYGTSLEVAKYIDKNCYHVSNIVISNGYGEADALSIASVAGRDNMPIILVGNNNIPSATYEWLKNKNIENAYIIGGTAVVSDNVLNQIDSITSGDVRNNRFGGRDRFETNAMIIDRFYGNIIDKVYITKGYELIDALAAGPIAAINGSPVVLSGNDLSANQKIVLGKRCASTIIRTGGGISNTAVSSIEQCLQ